MIDTNQDTLTIIKFIIGALGAFAVASCSACGFTSPNGYTMGTTSYLEAQLEGRRRLLIEEIAATRGVGAENRKLRVVSRTEAHRGDK